jgi:large subunit ribosomal protein L25
MESIKIKGSSRDNLGRKDAVELRRNECVPCVLYTGADNLHFSINEADFKGLIFTPNVYTVELEVDGKVYNCVLKDTQYHPISDKLIHADFMLLSDDKPVSIKVPVKFVGTSEGVKQGGKFVIKIRKMKIKALPKNLPGELLVDISNLGIGQAIKIEKLSFPNVEILEAKNCILCAVKSTRGSVKQVEEVKKK